MHNTQEPTTSRYRRRPRRLLLIYLVVTALSVTSILSSGFFIYQHSTNLQQAIEVTTDQMQNEMKNTGRVLASTVVRSIERAVLVMDFLFVAQIIKQTVANNQNIEYGMVLDIKGNPLAHTLDKPTHELFTGTIAATAAGSSGIVFQKVHYKEKQILEVAAPIITPKGRFGTLRFGMSLIPLNRAIAKVRLEGESQIRDSIVTSLVLILFFYLI